MLSRGVWRGIGARVGRLCGREQWLALSRRRRRAAMIGAVLLVGLIALLLATADDIMEAGLDPKIPFQIYVRPRRPDYGQPSAWALNPVFEPGQRTQTGPVDVFFVHPTTFNGGRDWNGPIDQRDAERELERIMLPNYAGPFARVGRIFAPRYRQASLYAYAMNLHEDALDARRFAYGDVLAAFRAYMARDNLGRPFILAGVEQGASIADRLLKDEVSRNPGLVQKLAVAYLIDSITPAERYAPGQPVAACGQRAQTRCVVAWTPVDEADPRRARVLLSRALVWTPDGLLDNLEGRPALCVNPLLGAVSAAKAPARLNLGAVNASQLEWGARAAFLPRQVSAQCVEGVLRVSHPRSASLSPSTAWPDKFKAPPYNPFFADIEADAMKRVATWYGRSDFPVGAPPIVQSIPVQTAPVHKAPY